MKYYTYIHRRNDTNQVFYVGKGRNRRAWLKSSRNRQWKFIVDKHGYTVEIVAHWNIEQEALDHEKFLIQCFKDLNHPITNVNDGGDPSVASKFWLGKTRSLETKQKISAKTKGRKRDPILVEKTVSKLRGRKLSEDVKLKCSLSKRGNKNPMFGKKHPNPTPKGTLPPNTGIYRYSLEYLKTFVDNYDWIKTQPDSIVIAKYRRNRKWIREFRKQYLERIKTCEDNQQ